MAHAKLGSAESTRPGFKFSGSRRLLILSVIGVVLVVILVVSVAVLVVQRPWVKSGSPAVAVRKPTEAIARTCGVTLYPELCVSALMGFPGAASAGEAELVPMSLNMTLRRVVDVMYNASALGGAATLLAETRASAAYSDCMELLDGAAEFLSRSFGVTTAPPTSPDSATSVADTADTYDDVMTWLSAALTNHDTCHESLQEVGAADDVDGRIKPQMLDYLTDLAKHLSNCLAIFAARGNDGNLTGSPIHNRRLRRLLSSNDNTTGDDVVVTFPRWVRHSDRRLLQSPAAYIDADIVVAKDGSGTHRKIHDAVKAAPDYSHRRVVIYVKAGVYIENVKIGRKKTNLMLVGDGVGKTVVVGYRSVHDNYTTFHTATLDFADVRGSGGRSGVHNAGHDGGEPGRAGEAPGGGAAGERRPRGGVPVRRAWVSGHAVCARAAAVLPRLRRRRHGRHRVRQRGGGAAELHALGAAAAASAEEHGDRAGPAGPQPKHGHLGARLPRASLAGTRAGAERVPDVPRQAVEAVRASRVHAVVHGRPRPRRRVARLGRVRARARYALLRRVPEPRSRCRSRQARGLAGLPCHQTARGGNGVHCRKVHRRLLVAAAHRSGIRGRFNSIKGSTEI